MGKYNSTEQRISIPLSEYQRLTLDSRVLTRMCEESSVIANFFLKYIDKIAKEDMNDG